MIIRWNIPRDFDAIIGLDLLAKTSGFLIDYAAKMISFRNVSASQSNRLTCLTAPEAPSTGDQHPETKLCGLRELALPNRTI
jgi:hypothetical protein